MGTSENGLGELDVYREFGVKYDGGNVHDVDVIVLTWEIINLYVMV